METKHHILGACLSLEGGVLSRPLFAFLLVNGQCQSLGRKVRSYKLSARNSQAMQMGHFPGGKAKVGGKAAKRAQAVALHFARRANATSEGNTRTKHSSSFGEGKFCFPCELWYLGSEQRHQKENAKIVEFGNWHSNEGGTNSCLLFPHVLT